MVIEVGRSIASVSCRLDRKISQWEKFGRHLRGREREAFDELVNVMRNHRSAIDAADEADIGVAILLAVAVHLKGERYEGPRLD
jgi:hypothetical protein